MRAGKSSLPLRSITVDPEVRERRGFPFDVPTIRALEHVEFTTPVTFLVGENGSGKSTLLEALGVIAELPTVGSEAAHRDPTLGHQRELARCIRVTWNRRARRGFFLRAEDFFGYARRMSELQAELTGRLEEVKRDFADASDYARGLAAGPARGSLSELERLYGDGVDARSHGESFLNLFGGRLVPGGLFLLDEPEAALSPQSQLTLLAMLAESVTTGAQFIIATHAPILLAFPGATILSFDVTPPAAVAWDELEHVTLTRSFLQDPQRYTRHLMPPAE